MKSTKKVAASCSNCHFWNEKIPTDVNPTTGTGFCQIHPPVRIDAGVASFPTTGAGTWCGQWTVIDPAKKITEIEFVPDDAPLQEIPAKGVPPTPPKSMVDKAGVKSVA